MSRAARVSDRILGITGGEHRGHDDPPHPPCTLYGTIVTGSHNVFTNGLKASRVTDTTQEYDCCCSGDTGTIVSGSSIVLINGIRASRVGDKVDPHSGTASVEDSNSNGSKNTFIY